MESAATEEHEATSASRSLCHGSSVIVEQPRIVKTKYTKDFGYGFYCTILREQAVRWAVRFTGRGWLSQFKHPTHQMCFCSERALATLSFVNAEEVDDE